MPKPKVIPHKLTQIDAFLRNDHVDLRFTRYSNTSGTHTTWHKLSYDQYVKFKTHMIYPRKLSYTLRNILMSNDCIHTWEIKT